MPYIAEEFCVKKVLIPHMLMLYLLAGNVPNVADRKT